MSSFLHAYQLAARGPARPLPLSPMPKAPLVIPLPKAPLPKAPLATPGLKRALLVGINYVGTQYQLAGCINDVNNMSSHLKTILPMCKEHRILTDSAAGAVAAVASRPSRKNILDAISWLVTGLKPGENVFFQYSGHGGQVRDTNGDEVAGLDSCIYPLNGLEMEMITDDELRAALAMKVPAGSKCFVVLDCCHSGSAVDLRCTWQAPTATRLTYAESKIYAKTPGTVLFLSGCRDTETAADTVDKDARPCGALTMALLDSWKKYGAGIKMKFILWDVRKYLKENGYAQIPQLCTGSYMDPNVVFDLGSA